MRDRRHFRLLLVFLAVAATMGWGSASDAGPSAATPEQAAFFENRIRPLLADHCWECHGEEAQESGLRLDSLQGCLDGGERGPAIVRGKAKQSLLYLAVSHSEADLQMPEGDKLSAKQISDLESWIDQGAPWPGDTPAATNAIAPDASHPRFTDDQRDFWAFVDPKASSLPAVRDEAWIQSDIDHFVLAQLEQVGLRPAPAASKRNLLRRVYFDLIGLPPTPAQMEAFLHDDSPLAFERVVDQLLATPQYGERWGRHWLDVARYADSNGLDENIAFEFIYKYRDWVIQAFNTDLPADPLGAGYHITQAKIAMGSGGLSGRGFMQGTQSRLNFLPEKHTDFIFTTLAEEFGFTGSIMLLGLYALVVIFCCFSAISNRNRFGALLTGGIGVTFFLFFAVNMGMVMGLMPVVGVPLPLVSYGGSAMLVLLAAFGLVQSAHVHRPRSGD